MTPHWGYVTAAYAAVGLVFGALALGAAIRHQAARRRLAALDPRGGRA